MNKDKSVVVIGAGVSGLSAGALLAKQGFKVKMFEANDYIGGCCSTSTLDGYTFNNGAMAVIMPDLLDHVFAQLGSLRESLLTLRRIEAPQTTVIGNNTRVILGNDLDLQIEGENADVEGARQDLEGLIKKWEPVYQVFRDLPTQKFSVTNLLSKLWKFLPLLAGTVNSELNKHIKNETLRTALIGHLAHAGEDPRRLPSATVLALVLMLKEGYFMPVGGMGSIPHALAQTLKEYGGEIILNARAKQIKVRNGSVTGVEFDEYEFVEADNVISSASGMLTFGQLIDQAEAPNSLKRKVRGSRLSMKAFTVQLGLKNRINTNSYLNYLLPPPTDMHKYFAADDEVPWGMFAVPNVFSSEFAPAHGSTVEIGPAIDMNKSIDDWDEEATNRIVDGSIALVSKYHDLQIAVKRIRSPKDFRDKMNLYEGAIYGISPSVGPLGLFKHETPIKGLYLAGQTTYPGFGVTPAAASGILSAKVLMASYRK